MNPSVPHLSHPKYRPDIDGLRAIAVLSVVLYHAFPSTLKGGFIGVDIFFVISGFLISTIIFDNIRHDRFSFGEFYARRVRRIFPALTVVLCFCLGFGWFALFADEYQQLGLHVSAGAGFMSNLVLWNESGYFDQSAEFKPLLHLWSLGIEEQYYLVWPLLVWAAWQRKLKLLWVTAAAALLSFAANIALVEQNTVAAFYSPLTRAWELLCGSLLAGFLLQRRDRALIDRDGAGRFLSNFASVTGLALIGTGLLLIDRNVFFPGYWAAIPTLGTVLIIGAGQNAWLNRVLLSNKVAVWIGLISFPLYLWHWPLMSFAYILQSNYPGRINMGLIVLASIALAWLTYRCIERPIRFRPHAAAALLAAMSGVLAVGLLVVIQHGLPGRSAIQGYQLSAARINRIGDDPKPIHDACMKSIGFKDFVRYCKFTGPTPIHVALIGDSHASALFPGLSEEMAQRGRGLLNVGGRLFVDVATYPKGNSEEVAIYQGGIRATDYVARNADLDTVIMVSGGAIYLDSDWIFRLISHPDIADKQTVWSVALKETLDLFRNKKQVIFVLDVPQLTFDPRRCLDRPFRSRSDSVNGCAMPKAEYEQRSKAYRELTMAVVRNYPNVTLFDASVPLCDDQWCHAKRDGRILYSDTDHLSEDGSRIVARDLIRLIPSLTPPPSPPPLSRAPTRIGEPAPVTTGG